MRADMAPAGRLQVEFQSWDHVFEGGLRGI
jgi:hypothetical protein